MKRNLNLPKTPLVWVDGFRQKFRPECSKCGLVADVASPKDWKYINHSYFCPHCYPDAFGCLRYPRENEV
jgi:hypothetical protein